MPFRAEGSVDSNYPTFQLSVESSNQSNFDSICFLKPRRQGEILGLGFQRKVAGMEVNREDAGSSLLQACVLQCQHNRPAPAVSDMRRGSGVHLAVR